MCPKTAGKAESFQVSVYFAGGQIQPTPYWGIFIAQVTSGSIIFKIIEPIKTKQKATDSAGKTV